LQLRNVKLFTEEFSLWCDIYAGGRDFLKITYSHLNSENTERKSNNFCVKSSIFCIPTALKMSDSEEGYSENEEASIKAKIVCAIALF
jgi:hypothetical protein